MWPSEDNPWELVFSFHSMRSGDRTLFGLVASTFIYPLSHFYSLLTLTGFCARPLISFVFPRCASCQPCSHTADTSWQGLSWLGRVGDAAGPWVLARMEPEGFYYLAQIKPAPEASASRHQLPQAPRGAFVVPD